MSRIRTFVFTITRYAVMVEVIVEMTYPRYITFLGPNESTNLPPISWLPNPRSAANKYDTPTRLNGTPLVTLRYTPKKGIAADHPADPTQLWKKVNHISSVIPERYLLIALDYGCSIANLSSETTYLPHR